MSDRVLRSATSRAAVLASAALELPMDIDETECYILDLPQQATVKIEMDAIAPMQGHLTDVDRDLADTEEELRIVGDKRSRMHYQLNQLERSHDIEMQTRKRMAPSDQQALSKDSLQVLRGLMKQKSSQIKDLMVTIDSLMLKVEELREAAKAAKESTQKQMTSAELQACKENNSRLLHLADELDTDESWDDVFKSLGLA